MKQLVLTMLACAVLLPCSAQDAKPSREREALRRAQAALQQLQAERDTLQAGKLQCERDSAATAASLRTLQRQLAAAGTERETLRASGERLAADAAAEREREAAARSRADAAAAEREAALRRQLDEMRRERDERTAANRVVVAELAQRTQELADTRQRVQQLHTLGLEAVQRYLDKGLDEQRQQRDPVLGLTAVRIENVAEDLRMRLDAQRLPPR